jgi:hypothetical protein
LYVVLTKMDLSIPKDFLKPEKAKGLVFILFIPLAYIWYVSGTGHSLLVGFLFIFLFLPLIGLDFFDILNPHSSSFALIRLFGFFLSIIYWYVLACIIVYSLKKTKAKKTQTP